MVRRGSGVRRAGLGGWLVWGWLLTGRRLTACGSSSCGCWPPDLLSRQARDLAFALWCDHPASRSTTTSLAAVGKAARVAARPVHGRVPRPDWCPWAGHRGRSPAGRRAGFRWPPRPRSRDPGHRVGRRPPPAMWRIRAVAPRRHSSRCKPRSYSVAASRKWSTLSVHQPGRRSGGIDSTERITCASSNAITASYTHITRCGSERTG